MSAPSAIAELDSRTTRLGVVMQPDGEPSEAEGVLNPASARTREGEFFLFPRAVAKGNVSRVARAHAKFDGDRVAFEREGFALEPAAPYEVRALPGGYGCEDPRITFIPALDAYMMAYTAFGPEGPRVAFAHSHDALSWERLGLADFSATGCPTQDDKDAAFFPEPVLSPRGVLSLAFYHRPMLHLSAVDGHAAIPMILSLKPCERESIRIAYVPLDSVLKDRAAITQVSESVIVMCPDANWGRIKLGAGTPPVRIDEGWLSLYHGVDVIEHEGKTAMRYSAGIVVHDLHQPHLVLYRSPEPTLVPQTEEEVSGTVNNVVFPTAIDPLPAARTYDVYYGMADAKIGRCRLELGASTLTRYCSAPPPAELADRDQPLPALLASAAGANTYASPSGKTGLVAATRVLGAPTRSRLLFRKLGRRDLHVLTIVLQFFEHDVRHDPADFDDDGRNVVETALSELGRRLISEAECCRVEHRIADRRQAKRRVIVPQALTHLALANLVERGRSGTEKRRPRRLDAACSASAN